VSETDKEDRTEARSEKRLREAREKGDIPRSRDLSTAVVVLSGVTTMIASREQMAVHAANIMHVGLRYSRDDLFAADGISRALAAAALEALKLLGPVFAVTAIAAIAASALMGGIVEQNAQAAFSVAARGYVLGQGRIVANGSIAELAASGRVEEAFMGARAAPREAPCSSSAT
jgi:flagellar biosynthetic protein FlhB